MNAKTMEEIEFIREVKDKFSKVINLDCKNKLISVNDGAFKLFNSQIGFEIDIREQLLESNAYNDLVDLIGLKAFEINTESINEKIIGIIEEVEDGYKLIFEVLEGDDPIKYISNIHHFKLNREIWYKAIVYSLPDLIFIYDGDGTYLDVIARFENWSDIITGSALKLIGTNIKDVLDESQSVEFLSKIREVLETNETIEFEYSLNVEFNSQVKYYSALI
ncbi:MAG: PAS domain-containing protein [Acidaminobacteraceae bacterium]